jgi:hypothetical protein
VTRELYTKVMDSVLAAAGIRFFTPSELCRVGRTASHDGRIVTLQAPPAHLFKHIVETVKIADWLRERVGPLVVNSGYRSEEYNAAIGGEDNSLHMAFNALDLTPRQTSPAELARLAATHPFAQHMGIGLYRDQGFVHLDTRGFLGRPAPARWPRSEWHKKAA